MMEIGLLLLAAGLMFSGVNGESESMSCSMVNGKTICERQKSSGNTAMSSSQSSTGFGAPDYQKAYAGTGNTNTGFYSASQTERGVPPPFFNPFVPGVYDYGYSSQDYAYGGYPARGFGLPPPSGLCFNPFAPGAFNFDCDSFSSTPSGYDYDYSSGSRAYDTYSPGPSVDNAYGGLPASAETNDYGSYFPGSSGYASDYTPVSSQDYPNGGAPASSVENDYDTNSSGSSGYDYDYPSVFSQDYAYGGYPAAAGGFGEAPPGGFPFVPVNPFAFIFGPGAGTGAAAGAGAFPFGRR